MSGNHHSVGPLVRIDTDPDPADGPAQGPRPVKTPSEDDPCEDILHKIFDVIREQNAHIREQNKRLEKMENRIRRVETQIDLILSETRKNSQQIASWGEQCAGRCDTLEKIMDLTRGE